MALLRGRWVCPCPQLARLGQGLLGSGAVLWCPVSEQGTGGWLGLQFFCSCDLERYIPHHFSHTGFSLPLCRSCLIIGHGLLIKRSSVPDSFPASSSLSPFSSVKGTGLHQVMEFLRALGLSLGCISHVHQSSTRLVLPPGRLPCLAGRPGLLCTDCPAVPPSLSLVVWAPLGGWHLPESDDNLPAHVCVWCCSMCKAPSQVCFLSLHRSVFVWDSGS